jgi:hypothetical protein
MVQGNGPLKKHSVIKYVRGRLEECLVRDEVHLAGIIFKK